MCPVAENLVPLFDSKSTFGSKSGQSIGGKMRAAGSYAHYHAVARQADGGRLAATNGYARHIGRVGALAVALGVGAAIAGVPGIAWADDSPPSGGSTSTTSSDTGAP